MTLEDIYARVAMDTGLPRKMVGKIYRTYWRAVRDYVSDLPLKEDWTDEEFLALRPNVNIPSIGKLAVTLEDYHKAKRKFNRAKKIRNVKNQDNQAPVHHDSDNM